GRPPERVGGEPRPGVPVVPQDGGDPRPVRDRGAEPQALGALVPEVPRPGRPRAPRPHVQTDQAADRRPGRRQRGALPGRRLLGSAAHAETAGEAGPPGEDEPRLPPLSAPHPGGGAIPPGARRDREGHGRLPDRAAEDRIRPYLTRLSANGR